MEIQGKTAPRVPHSEPKDQPSQHRNDPGEWPEHACRRKVDRLLVDEDRAAVKGNRCESTLNHPKAAAQNYDCEYEEDRKQRNLQLEHVPINRRVTQRSKPQCRDVN